VTPATEMNIPINQIVCGAAGDVLQSIPYVVYEGGYKSWSPADVFEKGYTKI